MMLIARQLDDARLSKSSRSSVCIRRRNQKRIGNKSFSEREKKLLFCLVLWGFGLIMASFIDRLRFSHSRPNRVGPPCSFSFGAGHLFCVLLLFSQMMAFFSSISAALSYSLVADQIIQIIREKEREPASSSLNGQTTQPNMHPYLLRTSTKEILLAFFLSHFLFLQSNILRPYRAGPIDLLHVHPKHTIYSFLETNTSS